MVPAPKWTAQEDWILVEVRLQYPTARWPEIADLFARSSPHSEQRSEDAVRCRYLNCLRGSDLEQQVTAVSALPLSLRPELTPKPATSTDRCSLGRHD
jgi:Myb-like DNA-binding domain